jgi:hypothetical protein
VDTTVVQLTLIDLSEDCICYIPTSIGCTLTNARWGGHCNTHCYCDANMQVDPVGSALQIEARRV